MKISITNLTLFFVKAKLAHEILRAIDLGLHSYIYIYATHILLVKRYATIKQPFFVDKTTIKQLITLLRYECCSHFMYWCCG